LCSNRAKQRGALNARHSSAVQSWPKNSLVARRSGTSALTRYAGRSLYRYCELAFVHRDTTTYISPYWLNGTHRRCTGDKFDISKCLRLTGRGHGCDWGSKPRILFQQASGPIGPTPRCSKDIRMGLLRLLRLHGSLKRPWLMYCRRE